MRTPLCRSKAGSTKALGRCPCGLNFIRHVECDRRNAHAVLAGLLVALGSFRRWQK
jgi:hypothetical protein